MIRTTITPAMVTKKPPMDTPTANVVVADSWGWADWLGDAAGVAGVTFRGADCVTAAMDEIGAIVDEIVIVVGLVVEEESNVRTQSAAFLSERI